MGKTTKRDPGKSVRKKLPKSGSKTDKKRRGTNKYDAVPKRPRSGAEHVPSADKSRRRSKRCVPTIEKKTANRVVLSGRDTKSDATQKSPLLLEFVSSFDKRKRQVKRKTSSVTTQGKKYQRKGGQSPFFTAFAEMFKSEHQQHKKKKGTKQSDAVPNSSLLLEFHSPVDKRRRKIKHSSATNGGQKSQEVFSDWTHVNDAVLKIPKFNAEPSPSGERQMVTRSAARKNRTDGLVCVPDDDFFMVGAGWQKPWDAKDKKTIGCSVNEERSASERERGKKRKGSHESDEVPKRSRLGAEVGLSSEKGREKATSSATTETKLSERYGPYVRMHSPWVPEDNKRKGTPSALPDGPRSGVEPVPTDDVPDGVEKPLSGLPDANLQKPKR